MQGTEMIAPGERVRCHPSVIVENSLIGEKAEVTGRAQSLFIGDNARVNLK